MNKKISVIIPIYNAKQYLPKCLESICNQTYCNLEIVCIDDGSTDGAGEILDTYVQKDARIIAVHQENGGESNARNAGLANASGEIITFVDCDDWIEPDMYECLTGLMEQYQLDCAAGSWFKETKYQSQIVSNKGLAAQNPLTKEQLLRYIYQRDDYQGFAYMWNKLYSRECLTDKNGQLFKFDESLKIGGDVIYLAKAAVNVKKAAYIERPFYHYRQREDSGMHAATVDKMKDWLTAYAMVIRLLEEEKTDSETLSFVKRFRAYHASNAVKIAEGEHDIDAKHFFQEIMKEHHAEYVKLNAGYPERIKEFERRLKE